MVAEKQNRKTIIQITRSFKKIKISISKIRNLVRLILRRYGPSRAIVSISIVSDTEIRKINKKFLNRNCVTDCISFDLSDVKSADKLFEVVVNGETAVREAKLLEHTSESELALYITHGLLHNLGFDDSTARGAKKMHDMEDKILKQAGFGAVYGNQPKVRKRN